VLVAAILSWMPTGIDVSVWHSFWTVEKMRRAGLDSDQAAAARWERLRAALWDMRIGYGLSLCTGVMFVIMGAVHLAGRGADLQGVQFAEAISYAYTAILGRWMYHVFMVTAFFAMFSTSYTVIDGFSRSFSECIGLLVSRWSTPRAKKASYLGFVFASSTLACTILLKIGNQVDLVMAATLISLVAATLVYALNLYCVLRHIEEPRFRPPRLNVAIALVGIPMMFVALGMTVYVTFFAAK
jgi:Mn2+/Fe2+ NRAMP family transporter